MEKRFNVRVYGIYLNPKKQLLLADEFEKGMKFTKFPGGGLEFGEGTIDCLKRECIEEMGQQVEIMDHFYTTDYFQQSAFNDNDQLLSIYYLIDIKEPYKFKVSEKPFDFIIDKEGSQSFRFVNLDRIKTTDLIFPVDKKVLLLLQKKFL
jgi:8-oxo-dGTP diphosphatase